VFSLVPIQYKLAITGIVLAISVASYTGFIVHINNNAWKVKLAKQTEENLKQAMYNQSLTEASAALANEYSRLHSEKQNEIDAINDQLRHALRVPSKTACVSVVSKAGHPGSIVSETAVTAEISEEFREFLISEALRGDELGIYAETAHEWAVKACKQANVICN